MPRTNLLKIQNSLKPQNVCTLLVHMIWGLRREDAKKFLNISKIEFRHFTANSGGKNSSKNQGQLWRADCRRRYASKISSTWTGAYFGSAYLLTYIHNNFFFWSGFRILFSFPHFLPEQCDRQYIKIDCTAVWKGCNRNCTVCKMFYRKSIVSNFPRHTIINYVCGSIHIWRQIFG